MKLDMRADRTQESKRLAFEREIMEALEDVGYDIEQIEHLYEQLNNLGIGITGYLDTPEFEEIEARSSAMGQRRNGEDACARGLAIDDRAHVS